MEKIKATLRIPTTEQYAYIETVIEGTPQEIKDKYDEITNIVKCGHKASHDDFYTFLRMIIDSDLRVWGGADDYNALTANQQQVMQSLKRFTKRQVYSKEETIK